MNKRLDDTGLVGIFQNTGAEEEGAECIPGKMDRFYNVYFIQSSDLKQLFVCTFIRSLLTTGCWPNGHTIKDTEVGGKLYPGNRAYKERSSISSDPDPPPSTQTREYAHRHVAGAQIAGNKRTQVEYLFSFWASL